MSRGDRDLLFGEISMYLTSSLASLNSPFFLPRRLETMFPVLVDFRVGLSNGMAFLFPRGEVEEVVLKVGSLFSVSFQNLQLFHELRFDDLPDLEAALLGPISRRNPLPPVQPA